MKKLTMKKGFALIIIMLVFAMLAGCAMFGQKAKPYSEMSPQERAIFVMSVYSDQYDLYLREALAPNLTEDKKVVLREKKKALVDLHPYIRIYANYAEKGVFAPTDIETAAMKIIDRLLGL